MKQVLILIGVFFLFTSSICYGTDFYGTTSGTWKAVAQEYAFGSYFASKGSGLFECDITLTMDGPTIDDSVESVVLDCYDLTEDEWYYFDMDAHDIFVYKAGSTSGSFTGKAAGTMAKSDDGEDYYDAGFGYLHGCKGKVSVNPSTRDIISMSVSCGGELGDYDDNSNASGKVTTILTP